MAVGAGQAPDTANAEGQEEKSEHSGLRSEWEVMRGESEGNFSSKFGEGKAQRGMVKGETRIVFRWERFDRAVILRGRSQ